MNYYFVLDIHVGCRSVLLGICIETASILDTDPYIHSDSNADGIPQLKPTVLRAGSFPTFPVLGTGTVHFFRFLYSISTINCKFSCVNNPGLCGFRFYSLLPDPL